MNAFLDHASTTPLHPAAREALISAIDAGSADPSRLYRSARRARIALDDARARIAQALGARPEELVLTSGGTESCAMALIGGARAARSARKPLRIIVSAIEHSAVLGAAGSLEAEGFEVVRVPVDRHGSIDLEALNEAVAPGAALVSVQTANPEVGTIQPIAQAAEIAHSAGALFHTDACAAVGHIPVSVAGVDLLSASSHKAYGPPGSGVLWVRRGVSVRPILMGDERERGRRGGLENIPAIAGFAAALSARSLEIPAEMPRLQTLTTRLRDEIPKAVDDVVFHGNPDTGLPGLVAFSVLYVEGEALLLGLDEAGISVHSGSSCTSQRDEPSHVLTAMGVITQGSLRISLGRDTTEEHVDAFMRVLPAVVSKARSLVKP